MISIVEKDYIIQGIDRDIRTDGRTRLDFRSMSFETGLIPQASGSCRVTVLGGTDVLVGVKVEVGSVEGANGSGGGGGEAGDVDDADGLVMTERRQDRGRVTCHVECSASAMKAFDSRDVEDLCNEYSELLNRIYNGDHGGLDLRALCIVPGSTCWVIHVDVLVLGYGGNLLDPIFIATRGALQNTLTPKISVEESAGRYEFDVADEETEVLPGLDLVPIVTTLYKVGARFVVDPDVLEERCSDVRVSIAVNSKGRLCAMQKGGIGGINPSLLNEVIQTGLKIGQESLNVMEKALAREEARVERRENAIGFR